MYTLQTHHSDAQKVRESIQNILGQTKLCSMATVSADGTPWINTAYFAHDEELILYFITYVDSEHAKNLERNNRIAINVVDTAQDGKQKQGLQLSGTCSPVGRDEEVHALRTWGARVMGPDNVDRFLTDFKTWETKPFKVVVNQVKIFDEVRFGKETWVTCQVDR